MTADADRPGRCNIGPLEIERRRRSAIALTLVAAFVAGVVVAGGLPVAGRLALFPFAAAAAVAWLQVLRRFCVAFAALGIRNFGGSRDAERVQDRDALAADRRMALRMLGEGSIYGALVTMAFIALPT